MKATKFCFSIITLALLGACHGSTNNGASTSLTNDKGGIDGGGGGVFVAGCDFANLDPHYTFDLKVSYLDSSSQNPSAGIQAILYDRTTGRTQGIFSVQVIPGDPNSNVVENIQSANDNGASLNLQITKPFDANGNHVSNLVHASLSNGSNIDSANMGCGIPK